MTVTYYGQTYTAHSEAALVALIAYLTLEQRAA